MLQALLLYEYFPKSALLTFDMTGFSSSLSMGMEVEWTHEAVHRCLRRTYEFLGTRESALRVRVVGSSSKREARSLEWGTDTRW